jgi:hypothetical protein
VYPRVYSITSDIFKKRQKNISIYTTIAANFEFLNGKGIYIFDKGRKLYLCLLNVSK